MCVCVCVCVCVERSSVCEEKKRWADVVRPITFGRTNRKGSEAFACLPLGPARDPIRGERTSSVNQHEPTPENIARVCMCVCVWGGADRLILIDFSLIGFSSSVRSKSETSAVLRTKSEGYEKKIEKKNNFFCFKCAAIAPCFKKKSKGDVFGNRWKS